jgi:hypothetical protein
MVGQETAVNAGQVDPVGTFDPLLSAVAPKGEWPFYRGGYNLWPNPKALETARIRLMTMGNSTSLWPDAAWAIELGNGLKSQGFDVALAHGAGKGNSSSQELLRVVRDMPALKPDLVLSLSGICDIGYMINAKTYPFAHKYIRRFVDYALEHGFSTAATYGYPDLASPAEIWCRNQKMSRALTQAMGVDQIVFLQPVQGFGSYPWTDEEKAFYARKAEVVLKSINKPYGDCVVEFYTQVRAAIAADPDDYHHIIDLTEVFADCPGAYRDHRHQSAKGVAKIAQQMLPHVVAALNKGVQANG